MIYIETGSADVYYNFGLEYYFTLEKRLPETVFLFWRTTPTLMVGKYQWNARSPVCRGILLRRPLPSRR